MSLEGREKFEPLPKVGVEISGEGKTEGALETETEEKMKKIEQQSGLEQPPEHILIRDQELDDSKAEIRFVLSMHKSAEDGQKLAELLKDSDVILVENISDETEEWRKLADQRMSQILKAGEVRGISEAKKMVEYSASGDPFRRTFFLNLLENRKQPVIRSIDYTKKDHPEIISTIEKASLAEESAYQSFEQGDINKAIRDFQECISQKAKVARMREELVFQQIKNLLASIKDDPELRHKFKAKKRIRIGVFEGIEHTQPSQEFLKTMPGQVERRFTVTPFVYPLQSQLIRRLRFFPDKEIPLGDYKRALLQPFFRSLIIKWVEDEGELRFEDVFKYEQIVTNSLSNQDIDRIYSEYITSPPGEKDILLTCVLVLVERFNVKSRSELLEKLKKQIEKSYGKKINH